MIFPKNFAIGGFSVIIFSDLIFQTCMVQPEMEEEYADR